MCIICVSPRGVRQPDEETIRTMFENNPHGAGYMYARKGMVTIHKGFMNIDDLLRSLKSERFTPEDSVVYHFRISTQAGVKPEMTHPFPLSNRRTDMKLLDVICPVGIVHNGIIPLTTDRSNHEYSDTALFITRYLSRMIREPQDLRDQELMDYIKLLAQSKLAILDGSGYVATVGRFLNMNGLLFSNYSFYDFGGDGK